MSTPPFSKTIVIDGFEYDVANFARSHPGGDVILGSIGTDGTAAYREFHNNSRKAALVLASLPKRAVQRGALGLLEQRDAEMMKSFGEWRESLVTRGFFKTSTTHCVLRLVEVVAWAAVACAFMAIQIPGHMVAAVLCLTIFNVRCGWLQHEAGHNSFTTNIKLDKLIQSITLGMGLSSSGYQWNFTHNQHHATPQKVNHDGDLDTLPLVAYFKGALEKLKNKRLGDSLAVAVWLRLQAVTFLPVTCGLVLMLLVYIIHPLAALRHDKLGLGVMVVSHVLKPLAFTVLGGMSFLEGYGMFLLTYWFTSMYLFSHFAMSHTFTPVVEEHDNPNWVKYAVEHSVDISPNSTAVNWIMGYLNYQVIHHLFPTMPQFRGALVHKELLKLAKEWGLEYQVITYGGAWKAMLGNLNEVGKHYFTSRMQAQGTPLPSAANVIGG